MKIAVAMSGGVDSSVAAGLLVQQGHEVAGFTLQLWQREAVSDRHQGCCSLDAVEDARRVAEVLGIPYYVLNFEEAFRASVIDNFETEYAAGRTPNPCIRCNQWVKFGLLLERAAGLGFEALATGHYARVAHQADGWHLHQAADRDKDQSYVLWMLGQSELARTRFPLGEMTKPQVREHATELGLGVAAKAESQDLCFVMNGDYREEVRRRRPAALAPGPVLTESGERVGTHSGIATVTVGQRTGIGLDPSAVGPEPVYVRSIDAGTSTVVVAPLERLGIRRLVLEESAWVAGSPPPDEAGLSVRVRHRAPLVPCRLSGWSELELERPIYGMSPGQSAAVYRGGELMGGGIVAATG